MTLRRLRLQKDQIRVQYDFIHRLEADITYKQATIRGLEQAREKSDYQRDLTQRFDPLVNLRNGAKLFKSSTGFTRPRARLAFDQLQETQPLHRFDDLCPLGARSS